MTRARSDRVGSRPPGGEARECAFRERAGRVELPDEILDSMTAAAETLQAGAYSYAIGGDAVAVSGSEPARPTVTALSMGETRQAQGTGRVADVTATIHIEHSLPAASYTLYRVLAVALLAAQSTR